MQAPLPFSQKIVYYFSVMLGISALAYYVYCWFMGDSQAIDWQVLSRMQQLDHPLEQFSAEGQNYQIPGKVSYVIEQYVPSLMQIHAEPFYVLLVLFLLAISLIWAAATMLVAKHYYLVSILCILAGVSLDIDNVLDKTGILYTSLYIGLCIALSFWLFSSKNGPGLWLRVLGFLGIHIVLVYLISQYSAEARPLMLLAIKCIPSSLVFLSLLSCFVAYEILHVILSASTAGEGKMGLSNFLLGAFIYLGNVVLIYLHNIRYLDWQMIYISAFLLMAFSAIVGYLLLEKRPFVANGATFSYKIIYLAWAAICFAVGAFAFSTANDALLEAIEDAIIYSHVCIGIAFVAYVFFNFYPLFKQGLPIAKVVYKPMFFPLLYFMVGAVALMVAVLLNNGYFPIMQGFSGYYSALGDHSQAQEEYPMAEAFYVNALKFEHQNHKANYALASLAARQGDNQSAGKYYRLAVQKKPSPYAYAALAQSLEQEDLYFDALFALRDGLRSFPQSGELQNNMALIFEKSKALDSTRHYLQKAIEYAKNRQIPKANLLGFSLKHGFVNEIESWAQPSNCENYNALQANALAIDILKNKKDNQAQAVPSMPKDSSINYADLAHWSNYQFIKNKVGKKLDWPIAQLIQKKENEALLTDLTWLQIQNEYTDGNKLLALEQLQALAQVDTSQNHYLNTMYSTMLLKMQHENEPATPINSHEQAKALFLKFPLHRPIAEQAISYLNAHKQEQLAYNLLLSAKNILPANEALLQSYAMQCLKINMRGYAVDAFEELKRLQNSNTGLFKQQFEAALDAYDKSHQF